MAETQVIHAVEVVGEGPNSNAVRRWYGQVKRIADGRDGTSLEDVVENISLPWPGPYPACCRGEEAELSADV